MRNHPGSLVFGIAVGLVVAVLAYRWISAPELTELREQEEAVVLTARQHLEERIGAPIAQIVDPLAPRRSVGKTYIYPSGAGFEVSGYYRRENDERWHPFLMRLDAAAELEHLRLRDDDAALRHRAASDPLLEVLGGSER